MVEISRADTDVESRQARNGRKRLTWLPTCANSSLANLAAASARRYGAGEEYGDE